MAGQGIDSNVWNVVIAIVSGASIPLVAKIYDVLNRGNKKEIEKNKEASDNENSHIKEVAKILQEANKEYFNAKFEALHDDIRDVKDIAKEGRELAIANKETLGRHDQRLLSLEDTIKSIDKRKA